MRQAERARLYKEWLDLGAEEQGAFIASVSRDSAGDMVGGVVVEPSDLPQYFQAPSWDAGDDEWPVSQAALEWLQASCSTSGADGIANKMQELRWERKDELLIDDDKMISDEVVFQHRYSCGQKHPGLCVTKDALIYESCLALASLLEASFVDDRLRKFFRIKAPPHVDPPPKSDIVVFFSHKRTRRPHAQVTHVFVLCQLLGDGCFALGQRPPSYSFEYLNPWTLAKLIFSRLGTFDLNEETYLVQPVQNTDNLKDMDGSFTLIEAGDAFSVARRAPRPCAPTSQLDSDKVKKTPAVGAARLPPKKTVKLTAPLPPLPPGVDEGLHVAAEDVAADDDNSDGSGAENVDEPPDRPSIRPAAARPGGEQDDIARAGPDGNPSSSSSAGPPAAPPADLELAIELAAVAAPVARGRNEVRVDSGFGFILINASGLSLDAHCEVCGLAVNRRWTPFPRAKSLKTRAQGRPMGLLLALLDHVCDGIEANHRAILSTLSHDERWAARHVALLSGNFAAMFKLERKPSDADKDGEPIEIP